MKLNNMIPILFFLPTDFEKFYFKKFIIPLAQSNLFEIYVINRPADLFVDALYGYKRLRKRFSIKLIKRGKIKLIVPFVLLNEVIHELLWSWGNINMRLFIFQVKRLIKRDGLNTDKLIIWCYSPFHWKVLKEIPAKRKIYVVGDEYCYDQKDRLRKNIYNAERKMLLFSDELICYSEKLEEKFQKLVPEKKINLISVPVDKRSFKKCNLKKYLPLDKIPEPRAVIFGEIRKQTDLALIKNLAIRIPNISIVFIGKNRNKSFKQLLMNYQNVYHLGFLSRDKVIYSIRAAVVGLYPGKKCKFSTYSNPIRIYEYAAAGIPVVASNISRESDYPNSIVVVDNDNDFIAAVQNVLKNGISEEDRRELIQFARRHSAKENAKKYLQIFQTAVCS